MVTSFSATGNQLSGSIPPSLGSLHSCDVDVSNNRLSGSLPESFSPWFTRGYSSHELTVNGNKLSGYIPEYYCTGNKCAGSLSGPDMAFFCPAPTSCPVMKDGTVCGASRFGPDPALAAWSPWSDCSVSCGSGTHQHSTDCWPQGMTSFNSSTIVETLSCNTDPCPIDCEGDWGAWSLCLESCGSHFRTRTFTVTNAVQYGGVDCIAGSAEVAMGSCLLIGCPVDCDGQWTTWSDCSTTCGTGTRHRTFSVSTAAVHGGMACNNVAGEAQTMTCENNHRCPVDCHGSWGEWSGCGASCGLVSRSRTFDVTVFAQSGGANCGALSMAVDISDCPLSACPVDCSGGWTSWSDCSVTCGNGTRQRTFFVNDVAMNGGAPCDVSNANSQTEGCENGDSCTDTDMTLIIASAAGGAAVIIVTVVAIALVLRRKRRMKKASGALEYNRTHVLTAVSSVRRLNVDPKSILLEIEEQLTDQQSEQKALTWAASQKLADLIRTYKRATVASGSYPSSHNVSCYSCFGIHDFARSPTRFF